MNVNIRQEHDKIKYEFIWLCIWTIVVVLSISTAIVVVKTILG